MGAVQGACLGSGVGSMLRGIGFVAKGAVALVKQSAWRSKGTDSVIGAVSSFSGTKATGGSNGDAMKNAGFGAVFGGLTGRISRSMSLNTQAIKSGGIGSATNAASQVVDILSSETKTAKDFNYGSVVSSGVSGAVTGALSYHVPDGILMSLVSAPRSAMIDASVSSITEQSIKSFQR